MAHTWSASITAIAVTSLFPVPSAAHGKKVAQNSDTVLTAVVVE